MSSDKPSLKKVLLARPEPTGYEVGYAKPPTDTQFKKGRSGNPKGRPKGAKSRSRPPALNEERLKSIIMQEAYRTITINEVGRTASLPMVQAIVRSLAVNAAKGNQRAQRLFTTILTTTERENKQLHDQLLETAIRYKSDWEEELDRRERLGIVAPPPLPHPDDIVVDMKTGLVTLKGPMTKQEKVTWDMLRKRKQDCDQEIAELQGMLSENPDADYNHFVRKDLEFEKALRARICTVIPD